jgi:nucleoside-diphosphate kinase
LGYSFREIKGDSHIVSKFREFAGPTDPELGKLIMPNSLRAKYGTDKIRNAVHCTDLDEDGPLESEYFFKL